jgi:putative transport protein
MKGIAAMDWLPQWFQALFTNTDSVAHSALIIAIVAATGIAIGSIKIYGISLGIAGVLFSGLIVGHIYGQTPHHSLNEHVMEFAREFGLILFVYTIGMQVGPGFFASLRRQGLGLNIMAACIVLMGAGITICLFKFGGIPLPAAVGLFSGATTNTPSLAAAQQALKDLNLDETALKQPGLGYAVAYPFGIIGIIITMLVVRFACRVDPHKEAEAFAAMQAKNKPRVETMNIEVQNPNLNGRRLSEIPTLRDGGVVVSRVKNGDGLKVAHPDTELHTGAVLLAVGDRKRLEDLRLVVGVESKTDLRSIPSEITTRRLLVTKSHALGKTPEELQLTERYGVTVTRVSRSEIEIPAAGTKLNFGDTLVVVGSPDAIKQVASEVGDSTKRLNHPMVIPIFVGIALGVILGSWAIPIPGLPAPVKLGLAGGPLGVAILLSRLGNLGPLVWYMPISANFMLREIGIVLFLACVGLKSGDQFINTLTQGAGFYWMAMAGLITIVPILTIGFVGRLIYKVNYLTLCGLLAGSMTDPPALAFAGTITGSEAPSVSYATVYPLVMLLRVLSAQTMVLILAG